MTPIVLDDILKVLYFSTIKDNNFTGHILAFYATLCLRGLVNEF